MSRGCWGWPSTRALKQNGRFYVNFTDAGGDTVVRRYAPGTPGTPGSGGQPAFVGTDLLTIDQPQSNHNGGWIGFNPAAPAGSAAELFIAVGDGGASNDPPNNAQTTTNLLGSILRIDVSGDTFVSPADNPFAGAGDPGRDEIFAFGLRNPYRASFDRATGDLYIGDVGQNAREEIDLIAAGTSGQNFGWRIREGDIATPGISDPAVAGLVDPLYDYNRTDPEFGGRSVTGGVLYRGPVAELQGLYLFADFVSEQIWSLDPANPDASVENITALLAGEGQTLGGVSSFGEDQDGNVYVVNLGGEVFRIVPEPSSVAVGLLGLSAAAGRRRRLA